VVSQGKTIYLPIAERKKGKEKEERKSASPAQRRNPEKGEREKKGRRSREAVILWVFNCCSYLSFTSLRRAKNKKGKKKERK